MSSMVRVCLSNLHAFSKKKLVALGKLNPRYYGAIADGKEVDLKAIFKRKKDKLEDYMLPADVNHKAVFANNETRLRDISVYGFDYDYTLASYTEELHSLIYKLGQEVLLAKFKYPEAIGAYTYDNQFAVRGLHYDVKKGLLLKIDSFHNIELGTVYRGLQPVSDESVKCLYEGTHVPLDNMNSFYGTAEGTMHQLVDLFAPPEMTLLAHVTEYLLQNNIPYHPEYVFHDVRGAVQGIHQSGVLHERIMQDIGRYLENGPEIRQLLVRLVDAGKKLFLVTNSAFPFVDKGMRYIIGADWQDLFDVVITNARKPKFFNDATRPFRVYNTASAIQSWDRVNDFKKGQVYLEGNFYTLSAITGWVGSSVLYFGDHVYSDLADPSLKHGWRTGAIITELEDEIHNINSSEYKIAVRWLLVLQQLLEEWQHQKSPESQAVINEWLQERDDLRNFTKSMFNSRFGSLFRTHHNPTYFSRRLSRFADLYMSSLVNLLEYSVDHTHYPRRAALPHEAHPYSNM